MSARTFNYLLIALGGLMVVAELALGAATGFDFALLGIAVAAGGAVGLFFNSIKIGLFSVGVLSFIYLAFLRKWIRARLTGTGRPTMVDAVIGRTAIVTVRIAPHEAGQVKIEGEVWRAVLASDADGAREPGASVTVQSVEGVTLYVK